MCHELVFFGEIVTYSTSAARRISRFFPHGFKVLTLTLLCKGDGARIVDDFDDSTIEFETIVSSKNLTLLRRKLSFYQLVLL